MGGQQLEPTASRQVIPTPATLTEHEKELLAEWNALVRLRANLNGLDDANALKVIDARLTRLDLELGL